MQWIEVGLFYAMMLRFPFCLSGTKHQTDFHLSVEVFWVEIPSPKSIGCTHAGIPIGAIAGTDSPASCLFVYKSTHPVVGI